jgi:hypothetical protein
VVAESSPTRFAILVSKLFSSSEESRACSAAAERARERRMLEIGASPPACAVTDLAMVISNSTLGTYSYFDGAIAGVAMLFEI